MTGSGTFETSTEVRPPVAFWGKADISRRSPIGGFHGGQDRDALQRGTIEIQKHARAIAGRRSGASHADGVPERAPPSIAALARVLARIALTRSARCLRRLPLPDAVRGALARQVLRLLD